MTIEQLAAVGLADTVTVTPPDTPQHDRGDTGQVEALQALIQELKTSLERERQRADILEHRLTATEQRMERLLPAAPEPAAPEPAAPEPAAPEPKQPEPAAPKPKRGFFTRLFQNRQTRR